MGVKRMQTRRVVLPALSALLMLPTLPQAVRLRLVWRDTAALALAPGLVHCCSRWRLKFALLPALSQLKRRSLMTRPVMVHPAAAAPAARAP